MGIAGRSDVPGECRFRRRKPEGYLTLRALRVDGLKVLREDGWKVKTQRGSHLQLVHSSKLGKVTVPHPRKSLPAKTVRSILQQAGIQERPGQGPAPKDNEGGQP